ncbi:hypothetical protein Tco_0446549, partial [Tanacetum coccineum]
ALDVVNYRTQQGEKTRVLNDIVEFATEDIRCRILNLPHRLHKSEILPLVGEGNQKRRRDDDNDDMHEDGRKQVAVFQTKEKSANQGKNQLVAC